MAGINKQSLQILRGSTSNISELTLLEGLPVLDKTTQVLYIGHGDGTLNLSKVYVHGVKNSVVTIGDDSASNYAIDVAAGEAIKLNKLYLPSTAGGTSYTTGTSGKVLKSNGTTVYWGTDNNTTYSIAKYNTAGLVKPAYSTTGAATFTTSAATNTETPTINVRTSREGRYYATEIDTNGRLYTNVPWVNNYHTRAYSSGLKISTGVGLSDLYVPQSTNDTLGACVVYTAADCTTYTSDAGGALTPKAAKKAVALFTLITPVLTSGTKIATITIPDSSKTDLANKTIDLYCLTNTHYSAYNYVGAVDTASNAATTNGNTYLKLYENGTKRSQFKISGSGATSVTSDSSGNITISSTDNNTHYTTHLYVTTSSGTAHAATSNGELHLRLFDDSTVRNTIKIKGTGGTTVTSTNDAVISINSTVHAHTAGTGLSISGSGGTSGTTTYSANLKSTTSLGTIGTTSKLYAVGVDANGQLCVNVPWTDNDSNVSLAATADTSTSSYALTYSNSTSTSAVTTTVRRSAKLMYTPSSGSLVIGTSGTSGSGNLAVYGDVRIDGAKISYNASSKTINFLFV